MEHRILAERMMEGMFGMVVQEPVVLVCGEQGEEHACGLPLAGASSAMSEATSGRLLIMWECGVLLLLSLHSSRRSSLRSSLSLTSSFACLTSLAFASLARLASSVLALAS